MINNQMMHYISQSGSLLLSPPPPPQEQQKKSRGRKHHRIFLQPVDAGLYRTRHSWFQHSGSDAYTTESICHRCKRILSATTVKHIGCLSSHQMKQYKFADPYTESLEPILKLSTLDSHCINRNTIGRTYYYESLRFVGDHPIIE